MSIEYILNDRKFILSYNDLKEEYHRFVNMTDEEFLKNIPAAAHLACVICYLKEVPTYICLSDVGIVHELIHMIHINNPVSSLREIRAQFELWLKLS